MKKVTFPGDYHWMNLIWLQDHRKLYNHVGSSLCKMFVSDSGAESKPTLRSVGLNNPSLLWDPCFGDLKYAFVTQLGDREKEKLISK